jgi:hypothetical protein
MYTVLVWTCLGWCSCFRFVCPVHVKAWWTILVHRWGTANKPHCILVNSYKSHYGSILDFRMLKNGRWSAYFVVAPKQGIEFNSLLDVHSWELGSCIRYRQSKRNPIESKTAQDIVCGCAVCWFMQYRIRAMMVKYGKC